ncbi:MAG: efflux RND transporter periplasmic adaptor subunit [Candidatus Thiodiazotropha sp.]
MSKHRSQIRGALIAGGCLLAAITVARSDFANSGPTAPGPGGPEPTMRQELKGAPPKSSSAPRVTVVETTLSDHQTSIVGYGETAPRYHLQLVAEVNGRVTHISPKLETGALFKKGELLVELDDTSYKQALASAQYDLHDAEVEMLQETLDAEQAKDEWKRSGLKGDPESELVLHEPQLKAAKSKLAMVRQSVATASADLAKTRITAPFDALVISRDVQPGSYASTGTQLVELYSTDRIETSIPLSDAQWDKLPAPAELLAEKWPVRLLSDDSERSWEGYVTRIEQHVNSENRQRALIVAVDNPLDQEIPLYSGAFVRAEIPGWNISGVWRIPESSLTQDLTIWYVDESSQLAKAQADVVFADNESVYIRPIESINSTSVAVYPLSSYLPGMRVEAQFQEDE